MALNLRKGSTDQYDKKCGCIHHEFFLQSSETTEFALRTTTWAKHRKAYKALVARKLITEKKYFVCTVCLEYSQKHFSNVRSSRNEEGMEIDGIETGEMEIDPIVAESVTEELDTENSLVPETDFIKVIDDLLKVLKDNTGKKLTDAANEKLKELYHKLGERLCSDLHAESVEVTKQYRSVIDTNFDLSASRWVDNRNQYLVNFLRGATNVKIEDKAKKQQALVHCVEQVLYTRHLNTICPFSYVRNLVTYTLTKSKLAVQMQSKWEPSGGYTTLVKQITQEKPPLECVPNVDIQASFDNNQKLSYSSGRIKVNIYNY